MIVFFALLGISCKRKIPEAHTSLEVVRIRYGELALVSCLGILLTLFRGDRTCGTHCVHDSLSSEQYLRVCQYASWCRGSNHSCVGFPQSIEML